MQVAGCTALVTGGSGGPGSRICRALALNGVDVAEQLITLCASESITGPMILMDSGQV